MRTLRSMNDPSPRLERLEESVLFLERAAEVAAEQTGELFRQLDALRKRIAALESATVKPESEDAPEPPGKDLLL